MRNTALVVLTLFILATPSLAETVANLEKLPHNVAHPYCRCPDVSCQPFARGIVDITEALRTANDVPAGACIFNPAIIRITGNLFCVFARVYVAAAKERQCIPGRLDKPPFMDSWNGTLSNLLGVIRLMRTNQGRELSATLLGHRYLKFNYEDGRIFRDQRGRVFLYVSLPFGKHGGERASANSVLQVYISCHRTMTLYCNVSLGPPRLLRYERSLAWDKNWVPWNGTSMMTYPHYGTFGPHSVFNWSSYIEPVPHIRFDMVSMDTFFHRFNSTFGRLIQLSGGTPAILEPTGLSYLAVGHVRIHPSCLHPQSIPGLQELLGDEARSNCAHMMKLSPATRDAIPFRSFPYGPGNDSRHYHVDYGFFFYRFNANPPYHVTHISHGILPPSEGHCGIVFPSALERFDNEYVIAYGEADQAARLLFLDESDIKKLLSPIARMEQHLLLFSVCTLPLPGDVPG